MRKLPKKPSTLIKHALRDMGEVLRMKKKYKISMGTWHDADEDKKGKPICSVCFAGSVMARSLGIKPDRTIDIEEFDGPDLDKLKALNEFRTGHIGSALNYMPGISVEKIERAEKRGLKQKMRVKAYWSGSGKALREFRKSMKKVAAHLKSVGL